MIKLKAFANNKLNDSKITISLCERVENTVGKEENAGYQHFLLFPHCFPNPFSVGLLKVRIVCQRVNSTKQQFFYLFKLKSFAGYGL